jgi:integrase
MSGASGVPTGPAAQRSGTVGAAVAGAMDPERAQPAQGNIDAGRDRNAFDDGMVRLRTGNEVDTASAHEGRGGSVSEAASPRPTGDWPALLTTARKVVAIARALSPKTQTDYRAKSALLIDAMDKLEGDATQHMTQTLLPYAAKSNSFFAMRAALAWRVRKVIERHLEAHDTMQQPEQAANRQRVLDKIKQALRLLDIVEGIRRQALLESAGKASKRVQSKRGDLKHFDRDWRERVIEASCGGAYEEVVWVLAATGCRPAELRRGVILNPKGDHVQVRIAGAKVTDSSGQPWRELKVSWRWMPQEMIERLKGRVDYVVSIQDGTLRSVVARIGRKLWPKGKRLCPYHFRHEAAADMRESGWSADEIGGALGQRVSETASHYGPRRRPGQGGHPIEPQIRRGGVTTSVPVRPLANVFDPAQVKKGKRNRTNKKGPV